MNTTPVAAGSSAGSPGGSSAGASAALGDGGLPAPAAPRRSRKSRKKIRILVSAVVILAAVGFVLAKGLGSALVYFKTADQAVADKAELGGQTFQIEGAVVPGSIHTAANDVDFSIQANGVSVPVVNQGSPPQLFQNGIPVVLEGHFQGNTFMSDQIMVKHSAVYVAAHPTRVTSPYGAPVTTGPAKAPRGGTAAP